MKASDWLNQKKQLKCSRCGRVSVSHKEHELDDLPQPDNGICGGRFNALQRIGYELKPTKRKLIIN